MGVKGVIKWTPECQQAFDQINVLLAKEAFFQYHDHNKPFHIYAHVSNFQLDTAIFQDNTPIVFYSCKLNAAQRNYIVGKKELLSVVETLKEFCTMLYKCPNIHFYIDHKNNIFHCLQSQCILCWPLVFEDFGVQFHYIKGQTIPLALMVYVRPRQQVCQLCLSTNARMQLHNWTTSPIQNPSSKCYLQKNASNCW